MSHTLSMPFWQQLDDRRAKSALDGELTPLSLDVEGGNASFAGSSEVYWADLHQCTCMDFNINQTRSAPCKHMARLAMELGLLPSDGKIDDIDAAQYRVALSELKGLTKGGDLLSAVKACALLRELFVQGKAKVEDTRGLDSSPLRFFFIIGGSSAKPVKTRRKDALALIKALEARLGEWLLSTPQALLAAFEGYEQTLDD